MSAQKPERQAIVSAVVTLLVFGGVMWTASQTDAVALLLARVEGNREPSRPGIAPQPTPNAVLAQPSQQLQPGAPDERDPFAQAQKLAETPTVFPEDQGPGSLQRKGPALKIDPGKQAEQDERDRRLHEQVQAQLAKTALAGAQGSVEITMYSTSWCSACKHARAYMQQKQIPFTEYDIEQDDAARARAKVLNPRGSVPTITIDQELLIGFGEKSLEDRIARAAKLRAGG